MSYFERVKRPLRRVKTVRPSTPKGQNHDRISKRHTYRGSQSRHYRVYLPPGYRDDKPLPLVMVLHGCRQDHHDIQLVSDFDCVADRNNFIVVYPFVTHYTDLRALNCWGWWRPEQIKPGSGEVEDLWRIVGEVAAEFAVDGRRVHIAGLSSGGAMAVAALTVHAGRFASGAVIAGVPYGESASAVALPYSLLRRYRPVDTTVALMEKARQSDRTPAPICIIHSHNDSTVNIQAGCNLRDSWIGYFGSQKKLSTRVQNRSTHGVSWSHTRYGKRFGKSVVETIFLAGPDHGWYGGSPGKFSYPSGPHVSNLMWAFFRKHVLATEVGGDPIPYVAQLIEP